MANAKLWKGVKVAMQSAIAAAIPITAISNANPCVITTSGTAPATGAIVLITAPGMSQIDGRVFRVTNLTATTFSLDSEDSTTYDIFTGSGLFQVGTLGVSITTATTVAASGGDFGFADTTTIHAVQKSQLPTLPNAAVYTLDHIEDSSDAGQAALLTASRAAVQRMFKFTFPNGNFFLFNAYVGFSGLPGGQAQGLVTTPSVLTVNNPITKYAA